MGTALIRTTIDRVTIDRVHVLAGCDMRRARRSACGTRRQIRPPA